MSSFISAFKPILVAIAVIAGLEAAVMAARRPNDVERSNFLAFSYLRPEVHRLIVHETDFTQVKDDVLTALRLDRSAKLGHLLGVDSAAHAERGRAGVNGTNDSEHRDQQQPRPYERQSARHS